MIRELFLLVLLVSLGFCAECGEWDANDSCILWNDPPIANLTIHNEGIAASLMDNELILSEEFEAGTSVLVDMRVLSAIPMVDARMPSNASGILWTWAVDTASLITADGECGCGNQYTPIVTRYSRNASAYFTFKGEVREVLLQNEDWVNGSGDGEESSMNYEIIPIPFTENELETANGTENMSVRVGWEYYYLSDVSRVGCDPIYDNESECDGCNCGPSTMIVWEETPSGSHTLEFIIESGEPDFFMVRPVLGEQWYLSNHFDNFVFSRKSIYKAEIGKDTGGVADARIMNFTLISFDVPGLENVWYIFSHPAEDFGNASMGAYEVSYWATPLVGGNNSFSHLYEVNHTYEEWGLHTMELTVYDFFGGVYYVSEELVSRKVTKEGISETGEEGGNPYYYRPGIDEKDYGELSRYIIPSSTTLVVFLVFALWAYAYYRREKKKRKQ